MSFDLDYDQLVFLDAENLAETGIGEAYELLLPNLRIYGKQPATIEEVIDSDAPRYAVKCGGKAFIIYDPSDDDYTAESWGRATYAFFTIVNDQLGGGTHRLYAINGGNDLGGMFLTPDQAQAARNTIRNKTDWPYIPTNEYPWHGQYH